MTSSNENISALLVICAWNSPVTGEFPTQRLVTRSFDVFFDLHPIKRLSKQSWGWWFETPSGSLWRHSNEYNTSQELYPRFLLCRALLWFGICQLYLYHSELHQWHCQGRMIAPVTGRQPWEIWVNGSYHLRRIDCTTTTIQNWNKSCACLMPYTVCWDFGWVLQTFRVQCFIPRPNVRRHCQLYRYVEDRTSMVGFNSITVTS